MVLVDNYGRLLLNLRIALTRSCNLHCSFCHAEGEDKLAENAVEMTAEEVVRITKVAVSLGISRIKLTGGEPLLRKDIVQIVRGLSCSPYNVDEGSFARVVINMFIHSFKSNFCLF